MSTLIASTLMVVGLAALDNARLVEDTAIDDPARAEAEGWMAFQLPARPGTRSPCCWRGSWHRPSEFGCVLYSEHNGYGHRDHSPETANLVVLARHDDGVLGDLLVVGDSCPVDGVGARVTWLGSVAEPAALDWLEDAAPRHDHALMAMAYHAGGEATARLRNLARGNDEDLARLSIYWLGEARGSEGLAALETLLADLPPGDTRRRINFALTVNDNPGAPDRLLAIAQADQDPEQQGDALFWLAESGHPQALSVLRETLATTREQDRVHRALHGLAQLDDPAAAEVLAEYALGDAPADHRGQALFWLAEAYPGRAEPVIEQVLEGRPGEGLVNRAVFALTQLPDDQGTERLLALARNPQRSATVRRQAIFWLAQSESDEAVDALVELLTDSP